ncbi:MAG: dihydrolipoyl dehydrogenase [Bradymonadales bacterium]|nr:dihydrolipoyl dehydrogenase [Bradymonadales bacterium]
MSGHDVAIIGAGPGGYVAAIRAAQLGLKVALIEKGPRLGGACLNVGCIPSKALLESSEYYYLALHGFEEHGIAIPAISFDLATMMSRKERVVAELTEGIAGLMKKNKVEVIQARAELVAADRLRLDSGGHASELSARAIILATGSLPVELDFMPFDHQRVIDSTDALSLSEVPSHLVVIGAGAVGLELGSVWRRLGAKVTVVEMMPQIAPFADRQVARGLERALAAQGLSFKLGARVTSAQVHDQGVTLAVEDSRGKAEQIEGDRVLVAVGRRPHSSGLGLERLGIGLDERGRVPVDIGGSTSVAGVYAIGDLVAGPMLAHKAEEEGMAVAERLVGLEGKVNYATLPSIVYTSPELATVGLGEEAAKARGLQLRIGRFLFRGNGRAKAMGQEEGMIKMLADAASDRLVGVQIVGPRASELIAEAALALELGASAEDLARTVHAHPTLSEVMREAALDVGKRAIHA